MTLTVMVTATVTQDGKRSTGDVDDDEWPTELRLSPLGTRSAEDLKTRALELIEYWIRQAASSVNAGRKLAPTAEIVAAQDLADRVSAMLTKLIRSV